MSTNTETNGEDISSADAHFIIECLKNLNESKQEAAVMESVEIPVKKDNGDVKMEDDEAIKAED
ncbi:uncharacterized protein P174DRAFT_424931 [Aspergillus novofumigatus IBT 16806]|uniref:Uncharacterized protein n=1 Tax=Aspergillus novofumigatus (strain IBT 16806) TaxID=1392255 RepID=A0A2I1BWK1_ASPN1|nr:uncharacterized protein P174DRAFT_424931 [Aspergillus novofumigatus IBT 16806]PKX89759.1 hypothetical protein P174DRAFT_424931 [Aspergillus novofumigatus IBT 16806]